MSAHPDHVLAERLAAEILRSASRCWRSRSRATRSTWRGRRGGKQPEPEEKCHEQGDRGR